MVATGLFSDTTFQIGSFTLRRAFISGQAQFFIAKFDSNGSAKWVWQPVDGGSDYAYKISLDRVGNIYVVGEYHSLVIMDAIELRGTSIGNIPGDVFVAKFDSTGHALWAKSIGGYRTPGGTDFGEVFISLLTVDTAGNPIIGGNYINCDVMFDPNDFSKSLTGRNMWMAKYSSSGNFLWAQNMGNNGNLNGMASDQRSNIYLTGTYDNGCVFDTITLRNIPVSNSLTYAFVVKYNSFGQVQWAQTAGDNAGGVGFGLTAVDPEEVIVAGRLFGGSSIKFGNSVCQNNSTNGNGFVAALSMETVGIASTKAATCRLSPNPANASLHFYQDDPGPFSIYILRDGLGRTVISGHCTTTKDQVVDVSHIPAGLYFLNLRGARSVTEKVNIQH